MKRSIASLIRVRRIPFMVAIFMPIRLLDLLRIRLHMSRCPEYDRIQLLSCLRWTAHLANGTLSGMIDILDVRFGNLWTNISRLLLLDLDITYGDSVEVTIEHDSVRYMKTK